MKRLHRLTSCQSPMSPIESIWAQLCLPYLFPRCSIAWRNPLLARKTSYVWKTGNPVAPIWRDNMQVVGKAAWGALLRKRKVTGRDASLPAPCLSFLFELVVRETVGALPQTPQGTLSLDSARGRRKGTKSPLDPFARLSWLLLLASSACLSL